MRSDMLKRLAVVGAAGAVVAPASLAAAGPSSSPPSSSEFDVPLAERTLLGERVHDAVKAGLVRRDVGAARRLARVRGERLRPGYAEAIGRWPVVRLQRHERRLRRELREARRPSTAPPHLQAIADCESGGNPRAVGGGGQFRGKYQFTYATWAAVGGSGDPAAAPETEQDRRAAALYARAGSGQWPVCGG
jgi:hypothetical protein